MDAKTFQRLMKQLGCCLLGICCPPGSGAQRAAFAAFAQGLGVDEATAAAAFEAARLDGAS
jgi:hypothetical protein